MKKLIALSAVIFFILLAAYFTACNNNSESQAKEDSTDSLQKVIAHGEYLANHVAVCIDCHSKRDLTKFSLPVIKGTEGNGAGFPFGKEDGVPGEVWAPNITPGRLKDWTDDDIAKAMTHGVNKTGDTLFPIMPYYGYNRMAKEDLYAIIAYIRNLPSSDNAVPARKLDIPMSMLGPLPPYGPEKNVKPDATDKIKYGEYLVTMASCSDCHTPRKPNGMEFDFENAFAGGFIFNTPMFKVTVANISPDSTTGIGAWTEDVFIAKFRNNSSDEVVNRDAGKMNTVMPWSMYGKMKEDDLKAIYAYLRTVKPVKNLVEKYPK